MAIDRHQDVGKARALADALKGKIREVRAQACPTSRSSPTPCAGATPACSTPPGLDKFPEELRSALVPSAVNLFDYAITVKQPLFTQGKVGTGLRLASIEAEGALSEIDRAQQDVALATVKAFYDLLWAERYRGLVAETQEQQQGCTPTWPAPAFRTAWPPRWMCCAPKSRWPTARPTWCAPRTPSSRRAPCSTITSAARSILHTALAGDFQQKAWEQTNVAELERDALRRRPEMQRLRIAERSADTQLQLAKAENRMRARFLRQLRHVRPPAARTW